MHFSSILKLSFIPLPLFIWADNRPLTLPELKTELKKACLHRFRVQRMLEKAQPVDGMIAPEVLYALAAKGLRQEAFRNFRNARQAATA